MSNGVHAELHIPDLWYDFYARFLPGTAFIASIRLIIVKNWKFPDTLVELILLAFAGYLAAFVTQPLSSRLARWIEEKAAGHRKKDRVYILKVQRQLSAKAKDKESSLISKMHGEIVFFIQLFHLSIVLLALQIYFQPFGCIGIFWSLLSTIIFFIEAWEISFRRLTRAIDYESVFLRKQ